MELINNTKDGQNIMETVTKEQLNLPEGYIDRSQRKKILLLSDDL